MKLIRRFMSGAIACSVVLAFAGTPFTGTAQTAAQGSAKVINLKGSARYFLAGDTTPHPLKVGDILKPGTIIQTASGSYVDVVLNNPKATSSGLGATPSSVSSTPTTVMYSKPSMEQDAVRVLE